ncbi:oligosaccharide repeat unit polymerase [Rhodobacter sp. SGA-6-6]|uniref:O-antigen polymerase n=1 Tax=Rhodobacter sp. SGA-6-6 TaxID=2710882 RepID=UPI0013ED82F1|nr:O-antigen polymerase [Rhodobacter sp. SGA-6-6]NGM44569.1 oligosaccharide repeat unit polymerase [Rhodobacter sp. SGA-6-6]
MEQAIGRREFFLASPVIWIAGVLLFQFCFWLIAFPDSPTMIDGEPREYNPFAFLTLFLIFVWMVLGLVLGYFGKPKLVARNYMGWRSARNIAIFLHAVSFLAMVIQLLPVLSNPASLAQILEPAGINRQASDLRETSFGVPTLVVLWIPAFAIYVAALNFRYSRQLLICTVILFVSVVFYGIMMMSRTHIMTAILILVATNTIYGVRRFGIRKVLIIAIPTFLVIWGNSLIRTGVLYSSTNDLPLFAPEVQYYLLQEFVEKYLAGEFNNSLIIATYSSSPSDNFLYGTMFARFGDTYRPPRFLNTMNILGYYYWQFGFLGAQIFALLWGYMAGLVSKAGVIAAKRGINLYTLIYLVSFPGFLQISRINYFFLQYMIVPAATFIVAFALMTAMSRNGGRRPAFLQNGMHRAEYKDRITRA